MAVFGTVVSSFSTEPFASYSFKQPPQDSRMINDVTGATDAVGKSFPEGPGPTWVPDFGGAMRFESMDVIELPKTLRGRAVFSVSVWFRADVSGAPLTLLASAKGYALAISYEKTDSGRLRWGEFTTAWKGPLLSDAAPLPGYWHHAVVTCDGQNAILYVDGVLQAQRFPVDGAIATEGEPEWIGAYATNHASKWIGLMKDVRFYDQALGEQEIRQLYESRADLRAAAPVDLAKSSVPTDWQTPDGPDYLKLVKGYADIMIAQGRDRYGPEQTPLFAAALNRETFRVGSFPSISGIRGGDRITTGANPMNDENLYQVLNALSVVTGDPRYKTEADKALAYFFKHAQSPATGLLAWGEHMGWDFKKEGPIRDTHEFFRPWLLWDQSYDLDAPACLSFARGLWDHQIQNQKTGNYSRHGEWLKHGPRAGFEFPRHGGFYIFTWARAFKQSQAPEFLTAITTLVTMFDRNKSPQSDAIRCGTAPVYRGTLWPASNLSLAVDLTAAASLVPDPPKNMMLKQADDIDKTFLQLAHRQGGLEEFFVVNANVDTLEPMADKEHTAYARLWAASYGHFTSAQIGNLCYLRYLQLPEGATKDAYRKLILESAARYLTSEPDLQQPIYPGAIGDVLSLLLSAYEISGDAVYLGRADFFARIAVEKFFPDGVPLPVASSRNTHYEAVTRGDTLMMELLRLWNIRQPKPQPISLIYSDR